MNADAIAVALFNATWQSIGLVAATALGLRLFGKAGARFRCALWSALFFICAALPFVDGALTHRVVVRHELVAVTVTRAAAGTPAGQYLVAPPRRLTVLVPKKTAVADAGESTVVRGARVLQQAGAVTLGLYLAGVTVALARFAYEVISLIALKRRCRPIPGEELPPAPLPRGARLVTGEKVSVPCVLALGRPVIAIPRDMLSELDAIDLRRIVAHEAAHLERFDDWINLVERFVLAAFFFNPAMHYAIRQIATEREIACDDRVVMHDGGSLRYAECLTTLAQRNAVQRRVPAPGLYSARKQIVVRVERLLDRAYDRSRPFGPGIVATAIAVLGLAIGGVGYNVPLVADAQVVAAAPPVAPAPQAHTVAPVKAAPASAAQIVPPMHVAIPPMHVAIPPMHVAIPPMRVAIPRMHVAIPAMHAPNAPMRKAIAPAAVAVAPPAPATPHSHASMIESLQSNGYTGLSVDQLVCLADHGVSAAAITGYARAFGHPTVDQMVRLADHGVSPRSIDGWKSAGLSQLTPDEAIRLMDNGVSPRAVSEALRVLHAPVSVDDIIRAANSGALAP